MAEVRRSGFLDYSERTTIALALRRTTTADECAIDLADGTAVHFSLLYATLALLGGTNPSKDDTSTFPSPLLGARSFPRLSAFRMTDSEHWK